MNFSSKAKGTRYIITYVGFAVKPLISKGVVIIMIWKGVIIIKKATIKNSVMSQVQQFL